jgi:hypothetical protein
MAIDRNKKMTYAEFLNLVDEDIRRMASGTEAQDKWIEVTSRIADALEHQVINSTMQLLAAPSKDFPYGRTAPLYINAHLASCGACTMIRKAEPVEASPIMQGAIQNVRKILSSS